MKICWMCDLHLPFDRNALQYDVLEWAIEDIKRQNPDGIAFAGDVTCDGSLEVYQWFIERMQSLQIPFLFVPGNSDLRCETSRSIIRDICSACENEINGVRIFAVNDCAAVVSDEQLALLEKAERDSIVFMHHPFKDLSAASRERLMRWRENHPETMLFYGHRHETKVEGSTVSLQAMDPDKAIGECPCITYYDTRTRELCKAHYNSPVPEDWMAWLGVSCYDTIGHIRFCVEHKLKNLELRPNCIHEEPSELAGWIAKWRQSGGENLSIHLPDVKYTESGIVSEDVDKFMELVKVLHADRLTQHVPRVSVGCIKTNPDALENICCYLAEKFNAIEHEMVIGVENMHMMPAEKADDARRFGYIPEECIAFMKELQSRCRHHVGINFDIGHARNNAPFSQKYQTSTWLSQIGKYAVGYHIHQVTTDEGKFNNHMPITDAYGKLISYASFFKCWNTGKINKAPLILEMRPQDAYEISLNTFEKALDIYH